MKRLNLISHIPLVIAGYLAYQSAMSETKTKPNIIYLGNDPSEQNNVADNYPELVAEMKAILVSERTPEPKFPIK